MLEGGGPIRATVIHEILTNSIEAVRESSPEQCFMALTPMDDTIVGPALPVIDIWNDPGVWAVLDEGCNSTVCGEEWLERATACYAAVGYDVVKVSDVGKPFKGLSGTCVTKGSFRLPLGKNASYLEFLRHMWSQDAFLYCCRNMPKLRSISQNAWLIQLSQLQVARLSYAVWRKAVYCALIWVEL